MASGGRIDTPITATRPGWLPIVEQARASRGVRGLPAPPPGLARQRGAGYHNTWTRRRDGSVRVTVKWNAPGSKTVNLGAYILTAAELAGPPPVPVGRILKRSDGLLCRIIEHPVGSGLPWPVLVLAPPNSASCGI